MSILSNVFLNLSISFHFSPIYLHSSQWLSSSSDLICHLSHHHLVGVPDNCWGQVISTPSSCFLSPLSWVVEEKAGGEIRGQFMSLGWWWCLQYNLEVKSSCRVALQNSQKTPWLNHRIWAKSWNVTPCEIISFLCHTRSNIIALGMPSTAPLSN